MSHPAEKSIAPIARWRRVDLHAHTPFDTTRTWGQKALKAREKGFETEDQQVESWLDQCAQAQLDVVAITDHNALFGYDRIMNGYDDWAARATHRPCILPGVELSVGGCHFLVITDPVSREWLDRLIGQTFKQTEPLRKDGTPEEAAIGIIDFAACIIDAAGKGVRVLAMPAHVDKNKGLAKELGKLIRQRSFAQRAWAGFPVRSKSGEFENSKDLLRQWASAFLFGMFTDDLDDQQADQLSEFVARGHWPLFDASDPMGLESLGSVFAWMKMGEVGIEGVRQALLDPESRLRRHHVQPPSDPAIWIDSVSIDGAGGDRTTLFDDGALNIPLSPALTTLIGGRGSGKSAVIELIRWGLDRDRTEDFEGTDGSVESRVRAKLQLSSPEGLGLLGKDTTIELVVVKDGSRYRVLRTADQVTATPEGGTGFVDPRELITPRIVSQRQIDAIASNRRALRVQVDQTIDPDRLRDWKAVQERIIATVRDLQAERAELEQRLSSRTQLQSQLTMVKEKITALEGATQADIVTTHRDLQRQRRWLDDLGEEVDRALAAVPGQVVLAPSAPVAPEGPADDALAPIVVILNQGRDEVSELLTAITKVLEEIRSHVETTRSGPVHAIAAPIEALYESLLETLRDADVELGQLDALHTQSAGLVKRLKDLDTVPAKLANVNGRLGAALAELDDHHRGRAGMRTEVGDRLEADDADIRVKVSGFRDRESLQSQQGRWWGGTGLRSDDWTTIVMWVMNAEEAEGTTTRWRDVVGAVRNGQPHENGADDLRDLIPDRLSGYIDGAVLSLESARIDEMERFVPEDTVTAQFRDTDGNFRAIEGASFGQQNTAILSLLLTVGTDPLILDQPEDDLDNRYIYEVVVDLLRSAKTRRQLIVATHNANIPVNGDAESIIALDAAPGDDQMMVQGTLEASAVKEAVSDIMEGSQAAFRLRQQRYGY